MATDNRFEIKRTRAGKRLYLSGELPEGFHGGATGSGYLCPLNRQNAQAIRQELPWTVPERVGMRKSFGFGDRLGIATPGHLSAAQAGDMFPVLAQQSIREMQRARRSAQDVMDDVTWAVVEAGYQGGFGCDADHVKTAEDVDTCVDAGFIAFTLDPGLYVDDEANTADHFTLKERLLALPWDRLNSDPEAHRREHVLDHGFTEEDYARAAAKYGKAVAHVAELDAHIASRLGRGGYELEVSVDETETSTTPPQHRFIALELKRLGIDFVGLAPRFVGDFYKGVDYVGDLHAFEADYHAHTRIAQELGPYKLSIHSGSDKLTIYPIINKHTPQYVHVKTSGTSWLEALRIIAAYDPALFRNVLELSMDGYAEDRRSYHVNGAVERIPVVSDDQLPSLLGNAHARQVVHVAFGTVLEAFYDPIYAVLNAHIADYWEGLRRHFDRHLRPFHS